MALQLYLIRHGETEWAISGRHTGRTDIPLTPNGKTEACELGLTLRNISFDRVLTSPLKRAQHTCQLVGLNGVPEIEEDLAEWNYGDYEGKQSADIRKECPDWDVFRDGCPNGEMPAQVLARVDRLILRLRTLDGNVALFSHGQFGGVFAARWIGLPIKNARNFPLSTASVSIMGFDSSHPDARVLSLWNFITHSFSHSELSSHPDRTMNKRMIQRWENEGGGIPVKNE